MLVYAFRQIEMEDLGLIRPALEAAGVESHYIDLFRDPHQHIEVRHAAGLIFLGGPMSANDDFPFIRRQLGILETAFASRCPVLGVCLGAQLIARALGARVYPNAVKEIGWAPVERTDAGKIDPLFAAFHDPEIVLHWHGETFDLPTGATWLAFSRHCAHQAFRFGTTVYGLQFHLEATPDMIRRWSAAEINAAHLAELDAPVDPDAHAGRMRELSAATVAPWIRLLTRAASAAGDH